MRAQCGRIASAMPQYQYHLHLHLQYQIQQLYDPISLLYPMIPRRAKNARRVARLPNSHPPP